MEVLERPLQEFDEAKWDEQMKAVGMDAESDGPPRDMDTLRVALGAPEPLDDLWPGHCYVPPKIRELRELFPLARTMSEKYEQGETLDALIIGCQIVQSVARKLDGTRVSVEEVEATFDEEEIAALIQHIMTKEGVWVESPNGAGGSRGRTGLKSFHSSAAAVPDTPSNPAEN